MTGRWRTRAGRYASARRALYVAAIEDHAAGAVYETARSAGLYRAALAAGAGVPAWRRRRIDRRILRELDFWNRTGGAA
jgi:2-hydroxychromene-2-carboxylate isomerase